MNTLSRRILIISSHGPAWPETLDLRGLQGVSISAATFDDPELDTAVRIHCDAVLVYALSEPVSRVQETVEKLRGLRKDLPVILVGDKGPLLNDLASRLYDCFHPPLDMDRLSRSLQHAIDWSRLADLNAALAQQLHPARAEQPPCPGHDFIKPAFIGVSGAAERIRRTIAEVAPTGKAVLLEGEHGTGKELVARLIHGASGRETAGLLVKMNCLGIAGPLMESELFGHEKGAWAIARERKPGRIELAAHGTLFLNEISALPLELQEKLAEVLERGEFSHLGGGKPVRLETRVIAAVTEPVRHLIASGKIRAELYDRLDPFTLSLPPLRERLQDLPALADHFLKKYAPMSKHANLALSEEVLSLMLQYPWPDNVRGLEDVIRSYVLSGSEETLVSALDRTSATVT